MVWGSSWFPTPLLSYFHWHRQNASRQGTTLLRRWDQNSDSSVLRDQCLYPTSAPIHLLCRKRHVSFWEHLKNNPVGGMRHTRSATRLHSGSSQVGRDRAWHFFQWQLSRS